MAIIAQEVSDEKQKAEPYESCEPGIRDLIWSAPPSFAFCDIRMRGGAFVAWC